MLTQSLGLDFNPPDGHLPWKRMQNMGDWRSGPDWDGWTLSELDGYEIQATCQACGHVSKLNPRQLRRFQPRNFSWIAIGPRLKCDACEEKAAKLRLIPVRYKIQRLPKVVH